MNVLKKWKSKEDTKALLNPEGRWSKSVFKVLIHDPKVSDKGADGEPFQRTATWSETREEELVQVGIYKEMNVPIFRNAYNPQWQPRGNAAISDHEPEALTEAATWDDISGPMSNESFRLRFKTPFDCYEAFGYDMSNATLLSVHLSLCMMNRFVKLAARRAVGTNPDLAKAIEAAGDDERKVDTLVDNATAAWINQNKKQIKKLAELNVVPHEIKAMPTRATCGSATGARL